MSKTVAQIKQDLNVGGLHERVSDIVDYLEAGEQVGSGRLLISCGSSILGQGLYNTTARFGYDGVGPCEWARILTNQRFVYRNAAVSGEDSEAMLARFQTDVLDYNPDIVVMQNGTNEIGDGFETIWGNTKTLYDRILNNGSNLIACAILPRGSASSWDDDNLETALALNEAKRAYCEKNRNAHFADFTKYIIDPSDASGEPLTGMLRDGTHFTPKGAFRAAKVLQPIIEGILPEHDVLSRGVLTADDSDLVYGVETVNPAFTGTGGTANTGISGDVPDDWRVERIGAHSGTAVCAVAAKSTLDPTRELAVTFTPSGSGDDDYYIRTNSATTTINSAVDLYEALAAVDVSAWDGILRTPPFSSDGGQRLRLRVIVDGTASGTGVLKVSNPQLRRCNPDLIPLVNKITQGVVS